MSMKVRGGIAVALMALVVASGCARSPEAKKARHLERGDRFFSHEQYREAVIEYRNVRRLEAANVRATRQLGLAHFQLGEMGQAFDYLRKARELEPGDRDVRLKLGTIYLLARHVQEAQNEAAFVLKIDPEDFDASLLSAVTADTPDEVDVAIRRLEDLRPLYGKRARLHVGLGTLYLRKGDLVRTEHAFKEAVSHEPNSLEAHAALGDLYMTKRDTVQAEREFKAAAAIAPAGSRPRLKLAEFYVLLQKPEEARRILNDITDKAPDYVSAWRRLAEMAFAEGKHDESLKLLAVVFKKSTADVEGHLLSGRIHLAKRETTKAVEQFQTVLKLEPGLTEARYLLALTHLQAGNLQQARADLKEVTAADGGHTEAVILLAELDIQAGALGPAVEALEKVLAKRPDELRAHAMLGSAYLARSEPIKGTEAFRKIRALAPNDPKGPYLIGVSLWAQGKLPEARRELEASLALAPAFIEPLAQLVTMAFMEKAPDQAVERVHAQIARVPRSAALYRMLGDVHVRRNEADRAEAAYLKAVELDASLLGAYLALADLYATSGKYDQALERVTRALRIDGKSVTGHMLAGMIHERRGDIPKARQAYEQVLALRPRFAPAANNLAYLHSVHRGNQEKALELAQIAKEGAPDDPHFSDTLAWILYRRGVYQRALSLLKESAAKLPDNPEVQYHLGMVHHKLGSREAAKEALTRAVKPGSAFPGVEEARITLATL